MIIVVTGPRGSGKSTALIRLSFVLRGLGLSTGGVISAAADGGQGGYRIYTPADNRQQRLAVPRGPDRDGGTANPGFKRFRAFDFYEDALDAGNRAILAGLEADCLFIDEIGLWELQGGGWSLHLPLLAGFAGAAVIGLRQDLAPALEKTLGLSPDALINLQRMDANQAVSELLGLFPGAGGRSAFAQRRVPSAVARH